MYNREFLAHYSNEADKSLMTARSTTQWLYEPREEEAVAHLQV